MAARLLRVIDSESRMSLREVIPPRPPGFAADGLPALIDGRGRRYVYLRLSVTDRCDLACTYCMPPGGEGEHADRVELLTFEEATRLVSIVERMGVRRVRLTGGEPLVRKDVLRLVDGISGALASGEVVLTTNGTRLGELASGLASYGLRGVNVSLDSLDAERFRTITRGGDLHRVMAGIHAAIDAGLVVKLNTVLLGGQNDDELVRIVDFAWSIGVTPRFIELMPIGEGATLPRERFITAKHAAHLLADRIDVEAGAMRTAARVEAQGPASYVDARDGSGRRVGFITAISDEFCAACNRVRINARGDVRACLASRRAVSLRDLFRAGASDADIAWALHFAVLGKSAGHFFLDPEEKEHERIGMSLIGG